MLWNVKVSRPDKISETESGRRFSVLSWLESKNFCTAAFIALTQLNCLPNNNFFWLTLSPFVIRPRPTTVLHVCYCHFELISLHRFIFDTKSGQNFLTKKSNIKEASTRLFLFFHWWLNCVFTNPKHRRWFSDNYGWCLTLSSSL